MNTKKKVLSIILALILALSTFAVAPIAAAETDPTAVSDTAICDPASVDDDPAADESLEQIEASAREGFALDAIADNEAAEPDMTQSRKGADLAETGAGVTYTVSGSTLTISGSGSMKDLKSDRTYPWSSSASTVKTIVIENGVTDIYNYAFMDFKSLTSVTIPSSVTLVGEAAFYQCTSLTEIVLPDVEKIGDGAFAGCTKLSTVEMPAVKEIGEYSFQSSVIKTLALGKALEKLSSLAFFGVNLTSVSVDSANPNYQVVDGVMYNKAKDTLILYPCGKAGTSFTVPASVKTIGDEAFANNRNLTSIDLNWVTTLGESAFQNTYVLKSITFPDTLTKVGYFTFYKSVALESVTFGKGLKSTSYMMFEESPKLNHIDFGGLQTIYARTFATCTALTDITLPATVTKIGNAAFGQCYNLKSISAPGVTGIPYQSFLKDNNLTSIDFPNLQIVYRAAFLGCYSLGSVNLPESTTFVHSIAFEKCIKLTSKNKELKPYGYNGLRPIQQISVSGTEDYKEAFEVLALTNKERTANGLAPLVMDQSLLDAAMLRAAENTVCFSHTRPNGSICFSASDLMAGENIAIGQHSAAEAMESWMNSTGHRENILTEKYTTIGIGCFKNNGSTTWVQCFGTGDNTASCAQPSNKQATRVLDLATEPFEEASDNSTGITFSFDDQDSYAFVFTVGFDANTIDEGKTTQATMRVANAGFKYSSAALDPVGVTWSSSAADVATVSDTGLVTGIGNGTASISAKLPYYTASSSITVRGKLKAPVLTGVSNIDGGVSISWKASDGAKSYRVFRKTADSSWTLIATTSQTSATDKTVKSGTSYTYTVRCYDPDSRSYVSDYDPVGKTITYTPAPVITKLENINNGTKLTWGKVAGAAKYRVFVHTSKGWSKIGDTSALSYTYTKVKSGKMYEYSVRAMNAKGQYISGFRSPGWKCTFVAAPTAPSLKNTKNGIQISWKKPAGGVRFRVFRKTGSGKWIKVGNTTSTSFLDKTAKNGTIYTYTVRCITKDGKRFTSYYNMKGSTIRCKR